jgi:hypothetical protein
LFDRGNSPLPAAQVAGVDVRPDGVLGLTCLEFGPVVPFPNGVAIVDGDIRSAASWRTWSYGASPLPHYQLGRCRFDAEGSLWVSATSEGTAVLRHPAQRLGSDRPRVSASDGGTVTFRLAAGTAAAHQLYVLLGSLSGTRPGTRLPGGTILPLNLDAFAAITTGLPGFVGRLDGSGRAAAALVLPALPAATGLRADFAWALSPSWAVSNPVSLVLAP